MSTILIYLAGVATPFLAFAGVSLCNGISDWRGHRRYCRAWDKFSAEFDKLHPDRLAVLRQQWAEQPWIYAHVSDDRGRYFKMKWKHGHTTEV